MAKGSKASQALRTLLNGAGAVMPQPGALRKMTEKAHGRAAMHAGVRTGTTIAAAGAAGLAAGRRPDLVKFKGYDLRLPIGAALALWGGYREMKGKRSTSTSAIQGTGDGVLASYAADGMRAWGERMKAEADAGASTAAAQATAQNAAAAAPPVRGDAGAGERRRIVYTPDPEFAGDRGRVRARKLSDL